MENSWTMPFLRSSTLQFIEQDPTVVVLVPRASSEGVIGPGGGLMYPPGTPRAPQRLKLIHRGGEGISRGEGGQTFSYEYVIVGPHDAVIEVGDRFVIGDNVFVIESMDPDNGYERKAFAVQHGKVPTDG